LWQATADGWRTGWASGRAARAARAGWRPWEYTTPPPPPRSGPPRPDGERADAPDIDPDDVIDVEDATPRCWSDLTGDEQRQVADAATARYGKPWTDLTLHQAAAAVRDWVHDRFGIKWTIRQVLAAQRGRDDATWRTGPPPPEADDAIPNTDQHDDSDIEDAEIVTPACWSDLDPAEQAQVAAAATDRHGRAWSDLRTEDATTTVREWINSRYQTDLTDTDVTTAQAGHTDPTWPGTPPTDSTSPLGLVAAPTPAATVTGTPEGDTPMATGSGETTTISAARMYYEQLAGHAETDIASRIELSRTYMTAAQLSDPGVLTAIAHAQETAGLLAAASRAVVQALEAHRLMEEAVASTPGAASTDFYRPA
uniref:hypothetical protein n=1 Tax=Frankia sp. Cj3 TaxID=2880976 RepID=UPI001EF67817